MRVPGYTEIRELGHGGTGRVMLAVRASDGLPVAIKHLAPKLREDKEFAARFRDEARVIGELDSPHTARLYEYVEGDDDAAIVMELVDGITLRRLLAFEGATGALAALAVLKGALTGLSEAHERGLAHRDFKPENVIVAADGHSKLVDFGLATPFGETGAYVGTPPYMAPEQWEDAPAGPATDVYAAAVVLFECLAGHRPFPGEDAAVLAYQHQNVPPPVANLDEPVRRLVELGMAKDPAERPATAQEFLVELERVAGKAYGSGWETRGRAGLGLLTVPHTALLPLVPSAGAEVATTMTRSTIMAPVKIVAAGAMVAATVAALVSVFVVWTEPQGDAVRAMPPGSAAPLFTPPGRTAEPDVPPTGFPGTPPITQVGDWPRTHTAVPTAATEAEEPAATPTRTQAPEPTHKPTRNPEPTRSTEPTRPSAEPSRSPARNPDSEPAPKPSQEQPPAPTQAPPPPPTKPQDDKPEPLLSVSLSVGVDLPALKGGKGLLDADLGLGLGGSLLGVALVPGSVLLGRRIVARNAGRSRQGRLDT
ncbi:serine/threonine-protein kinase [Nonomuraea typhae]|uniref:serine/threonine-protein kinase n=1 Tax=Nonomuraea typhae TaxID=2603600 RepID=UPI001CA5E151|nr:serine/threonine-protein kinase [Nonomuraea typhae]